MRSAVVAGVVALVVAAVYVAFVAPSPPEPEPASADASLMMRIRDLEQELAVLSSREEARLEGRADLAQAQARITELEGQLASALKTLEKVGVYEQRLTALEGAAEERKEDPQAVAAKAAEVEKWVKRLRDPNENIRFSAALELARLKDLSATEPLIEVLEKDRDYYVRLGAATALGDIGALDGVPSLIEALNDPDSLVRVAASDALKAITGHSVPFKPEIPEADRREAMSRWQDWWRDNESRIRKR